MTSQQVKFFDGADQLVAVARVAKEGDRFRGTIDLSAMPPLLRETFEQFEEAVNGQMLSVVDEVEEQVGALGLRVGFNGSPECTAADLQIYPRSGRVSFKVAKEAAHSAAKD
jgi:hypothetical protein